MPPTGQVNPYGPPGHGQQWPQAGFPQPGFYPPHQAPQGFYHSQPQSLGGVGGLGNGMYGGPTTDGTSTGTPYQSGQPQPLGGIGGLDSGQYGGPNSARPSMSGQPQTLGGIGGLDNGSYGGPNSARPSMSGQPQTLGGIGGLDNGSYGGPNSARPSTGAQSYRSDQPQTLGGMGRPYGAPSATRPHTGTWDDSVNPWQDQGGPHTPTFWTTYLREGVQPHAYDAEAVALQSLMRRQHLGTVRVGTVVALPRTNLNNNWTYGDWDRAGWDLYAVNSFPRGEGIALVFMANIDGHTPSRERRRVLIPPNASGHVHVVPPGGPLHNALVPPSNAGVGSGTSSASSATDSQGGLTAPAEASAGKPIEDNVFYAIMEECMREPGMLKRLGLEYSRNNSGEIPSRNPPQAGSGKTGVQAFFYATKDGILVETQTNKLGPERVADLTMVLRCMSLNRQRIAVDEIRLQMDTVWGMVLTALGDFNRSDNTVGFAGLNRISLYRGTPLLASKERLASFILGTGWVEGSYEAFNLRWLLLPGEEYAWGRDHTVQGTQGLLTVLRRLEWALTTFYDPAFAGVTEAFTALEMSRFMGHSDAIIRRAVEVPLSRWGTDMRTQYHPTLGGTEHMPMQDPTAAAALLRAGLNDSFAKLDASGNAAGCSQERIEGPPHPVFFSADGEHIRLRATEFHPGQHAATVCRAPSSGTMGGPVSTAPRTHTSTTLDENPLKKQRTRNPEEGETCLWRAAGLLGLRSKEDKPFACKSDGCPADHTPTTPADIAKVVTPANLEAWAVSQPIRARFAEAIRAQVPDWK